MIRYLLDTNILSYFIRGNHPALMRRMVTAMQAQTIATSVICRAEIRYGQALMAGNDKRHKPINLMLLELPALAWTANAAGERGLLFEVEGVHGSTLLQASCFEAA